VQRGHGGLHLPCGVEVIGRACGDLHLPLGSGFAGRKIGCQVRGAVRSYRGYF
jgi:hypothetical protein